MNEQLALRRAIIDEPDNDTPRLVYADWLDENGFRERAEFIRDQIETGEEEGGPGISDSKDKFSSLVSRLILPVDAFYIFRRGFIDEMICDLDVWRSRGVNVLAYHPITRVRIRDKSPVILIDEKVAYWIIAVGQSGACTLHYSIFYLVSSDTRALRSGPYTVEFASERDAMDALNEAAFKWAKGQVKRTPELC